MMPTAAKLVAGTGFAALFAAASFYAEPLFFQKSITVPRNFLPVNVLLAFVLGWRVLGWRASRIERDVLVKGMSHGLTTAVVISFWVLLVHGFVRMIEYALRKRYDDVQVAVVDVVARMYEFARVLGEPDVIAIVLAGGLVVGIIATYTGTKWR